MTQDTLLAGAPVIALDTMGYITDWSDGAQNLFGYSRAEALGQHVLFLYADDGDGAEGAMPELQLEADQAHMRVRRRKKSGEVFWASLALRLLHDAEGAPTGMQVELTEVLEGLSDEALHQLYASIIENSEQGILITDAYERIVSVNAAFSRITGYARAEAMGRTIDLLHAGVQEADFRTQVLAAMRGDGPWHGEIVGKRKNGELFPQSVSISVVRDAASRVSHALSVFSDISVLRATENRMQRMVNYDSLTGLPNRNLFNQLVDQALASARRNSAYASVLAIKLDRLAAVNDTLGHEVGEELLRQVAQRLRHLLREEDVLARIGADEFVAALFSIQKREHSGLVAQKLLDALAQPFMIASHMVHVYAHIGIAVFPEDGNDTAALLRYSDVAAKRVAVDGQSGYLFFSQEMNQRAKERWQLEGELRHALTSAELLLYYQPKVSLRSGRIVGAEALIRWKHPVRGMVSPAMFIPLAEETGLILEIGTWVLEEACRQIAAWTAAGLDMPPVAVNLSARQFDRLLPSRVQATLERHRVAPNKLKLEITESLLVRGADAVTPIMNELVAMGLALAMDDFGTGYSSLAYLKKFPITTLKIDRSFVIGVPDDPNDCAIAQAIVTMGRQLRQEIVAEGIETVAQMAFLRDLGCDQLQGYLFSPPVPEEQFAHMVHTDLRLDVHAGGEAGKIGASPTH